MSTPWQLPPVDELSAAPGHTGDISDLILPLLRPEEEPVLGFWIEAGVLAAERLESNQLDGSEREALMQVRQLGEQALERMVRSNIRLVYHWARRDWAGSAVGLEDLVAIGVEGLIHGIRMWDYQRGLKLSTYVSGWIRVRMRRLVRRELGVILSQDQWQALHALARTRTYLERDLGRRCTIRELAQACGLSLVAVRELLIMERHGGAAVSLDAPCAGSEDMSLGDLLADTAPPVEEQVVVAALHSDLDRALDQLTARERAVVCARVGWLEAPASEDEVARRFGVSVEQVRATQAHALGRLRALIEDGEAEQFLETEVLDGAAA